MRLLLLCLLATSASAGEGAWIFQERQPLAAGASWHEDARWESVGHTKIDVGPVTVRDRQVDDTSAWTCGVVVDAVDDAVPTTLSASCDSVVQVESGVAEDLSDAVGQAVVGQGSPGKRKWKTDADKRLKKAARGFFDGTFGDVGVVDKDLTRLLLPPGPVAVGESWAIDQQTVTDAFGRGRFTLDADASKADVTLLEVVQRDGAAYGRLGFDVVIVPGEIEGGTFQAARMGLTGVAELPLSGDLPYRALDADVAIRFAGTVKRKGVTAHIDIDTTLKGMVRKTPAR